ncbi:MAG: hypothetical protein QW035_01340 [Candidatus Anstonellales archaeon]
MAQKKEIKYTVTNMVATVFLGMDLDLFSIAQKIKEVEYEPEQFPGAILRFKDPKATFLLFKNGKSVCVGCKNRTLIKRAVEKATSLLRKHARKIHRVKPKIVITNMVASADINLKVDLYRIAYELKEVEYEPEQFPGAIVKFRDPKASLLLFKNGRVICAGAKTRKEIEETLVKARGLLQKYESK